MVIPPPMPSKPAMKPTMQPIATKTGISVQSTLGRDQPFGDEGPFPRIDRSDGKAIAALKQTHGAELALQPQLGKRNKARLLDQRHVHVEPARRSTGCFRVVIRALTVELRLVGIGGLAHAHDAGNPGLGTTRMIKKGEVADVHLIAHEIARLVVPHAEPGRRLFRHRGEIVDRQLVGLGLHQPVTHGLSRYPAVSEIGLSLKAHQPKKPESIRKTLPRFPPKPHPNRCIIDKLSAKTCENAKTTERGRTQ